MFALSLIDGLNNKISKFLTQEDELDYMSDKEYEKQLDGFFDESTEGIVRRLKHHLLIAAKDECDEAKSHLSKDLARVQAKLRDLRFYAEDIRLKSEDGVEGVRHLQAKVKFCERLGKFYENLLTQVEEWSDGALSIAEANVCYFSPLNSNFQPEDLHFIYNNLAARGWFDDRQTSEGDFKYRFTGKGLPPTHPIKWLKSITSLGILLSELTDDKDKWSKASAIFTHYSSRDRAYVPVGRKSIGNTYGNSVGTDSYKRQLKEIQDKMLIPSSEQFLRVQRRWEEQNGQL